MTPTISVIVPSFNQGRFLETCLESVLSQRYPKLELIVIDGGSTDDSVAIIRRHASQLAHWVSEPDGGQSAGINKGLARATGEVVAWLNADDFHLPGALDLVARACEADPKRSFYFGDGWRVDESGRRLSGFFPDANVRFSRKALVMGLNFILQPATFMNRAILERVGRLDGDLHWGMDSDLWLRLSGAAAPMAIQASLAASREYGSTKTSTGGFARAEELRQIAEKHAGMATTPGAVCYWLDTLHRFAREREDVFGKGYVREIERFWAETSGLFRGFGARDDGFPMEDE